MVSGLASATRVSRRIAYGKGDGRTFVWVCGIGKKVDNDAAQKATTIEKSSDRCDIAWLPNAVSSAARRSNKSTQRRRVQLARLLGSCNARYTAGTREPVSPWEARREYVSCVPTLPMLGNQRWHAHESTLLRTVQR